MFELCDSVVLPADCITLRGYLIITRFKRKGSRRQEGEVVWERVDGDGGGGSSGGCFKLILILAHLVQRLLLVIVVAAVVVVGRVERDGIVKITV